MPGAGVGAVCCWETVVSKKLWNCLMPGNVFLLPLVAVLNVWFPLRASKWPGLFCLPLQALLCSLGVCEEAFSVDTVAWQGPGAPAWCPGGSGHSGSASLPQLRGMPWQGTSTFKDTLHWDWGSAFSKIRTGSLSSPPFVGACSNSSSLELFISRIFKKRWFSYWTVNLLWCWMLLTVGVSRCCHLLPGPHCDLLLSCCFSDFKGNYFNLFSLTILFQICLLMPSFL